MTIITGSSLKVLGVDVFGDCNSLKEVRLPDSINEIKDNAFSGCMNLVKVRFSKTLKIIGKHAFANCGITKLELPDSVLELGEGAFANCRSLDKVLFSQSLKKIGDYAFANCPGLIQLEFPASLTKFGVGSFSECSGLIQLEFLASVEEIGKQAFESCSALRSIRFSPNLKVVKELAFSGCTALNEITELQLPASLNDLQDGSGLRRVCIPPFTFIDSSAFEDCPNLSSSLISEHMDRLLRWKRYSLFMMCASHVDKTFRSLIEKREWHHGLLSYRQFVDNTGISPLMVSQAQGDYLASFASPFQLLYLACTHVDGTDGLGNGILRLVASFCCELVDDWDEISCEDWLELNIFQT